MRPLENLARRVGRIAALAAAVALFVIAPSAEAQWGNMGRLMEPRVTSEDVSKMIELLEIPESQEPIVRDPFQSYMPKHEQAREQLTELFRQAREEAEATKDFTVWQDAQLKVIEYVEYEESLI
jgi:hypothetical protein